MAMDKVLRGQAITQAQMDELARVARLKLGGYYIFPSSVWQVPDREHLLNFDLADWGVDPGGIVVVKSERKVYQLRPLRNVIAGFKSWEIFENWQELDWRYVDAEGNGGLFQDPPYHNNIRLQTGIPLGGIAVVVAPWNRSLSFRPSGGIESPDVWQYIGPGSASSLANWRHLGGAQEVGGGLLGLDPNVGPTRVGAPIWTSELRAIQSAAITKISDTAGRPWRAYLYGQRQLPFTGAPAQFTPFEKQLVVTRSGAPMPFVDPNLNKTQYIRMYKNIDYWAREPTDINIEASFGSGAGGNYISPPFRFPAGIDFNCRILNPGEHSPIVSQTLWGALDFFRRSNNRTSGPISDSTGVGQIAAEDPLLVQRITWGDYNDPNIGVSWGGGSLRVSKAEIAGDDSCAVGYNLIWKIRVRASQAVKAAHKSLGPVYRVKLPDMAVEVNGHLTPLGNKMELAFIICKPKTGDLQGGYVAKPAASAPLCGELKYPFGTFPPSSPLAQSGSFFTLVPYPCIRKSTTSIPAPTNAQRWTVGVDSPAQAVLYDVCATRLSKTRGRLDYAGTPPVTVQVGARQGNGFLKLFDVIIPAGEAVGHATADAIKDTVIMDNEPLYWFAASGVSMVQVLALRRQGDLATQTAWAFNGAQFGFSECYNETVDLLENL